MLVLWKSPSSFDQLLECHDMHAFKLPLEEDACDNSVLPQLVGSARGLEGNIHESIYIKTIDIGFIQTREGLMKSTQILAA